MGKMRELFLERNPKKWDYNFDKPYADFKEFLRAATLFVYVDGADRNILKSVSVWFHEDKGRRRLVADWDVDKGFLELELFVDGWEIDFKDWQIVELEKVIENRIVEFDEHRKNLK